VWEFENQKIITSLQVLFHFFEYVSFGARVLSESGLLIELSVFENNITQEPSAPYFPSPSLISHYSNSEFKL
jgi:hypothetical protein